MAGYSIYIYHITLEDANRLRRELGLPEVEGKAEGRRMKDEEAWDCRFATFDLKK